MTRVPRMSKPPKCGESGETSTSGKCATRCGEDWGCEVLDSGILIGRGGMDRQEETGEGKGDSVPFVYIYALFVVFVFS